MNYIAQINAFWEKFNSLSDGKPYHIAVYFALLHINNQTGWKPVFRVNYQTILQLTQVSVNTYYKACKWLFDNGFLKFYEKGANQYQSARFGLSVLYEKNESTSKADIKRKQNTENILKHIKQNKTFKQKQQVLYDEIFKFFKDNGLDEKEAQKFINYNESRGWQSVKDWRPLAENWIINSNSKIKNNGRKNFNGNTQKEFNQEAQDYSNFF